MKLTTDQLMEKIYGSISVICSPHLEEGTILLTSTPSGKEHFYDKFVKEKSAPMVKVGVTKKNKKFPKTLVIPDAHVYHGDNLARFSSLNKLILERKPDNIVIMGDWANLDSLSGWDLGKAGVMDGKRYHNDCRAAKEALRLTFKDTDTEEYSPKKIFINGNHENRLERYLETKPELKGHLSIEEDFGLEEFGFSEIIDYKKCISLHGVLFTHALMNAANMPVSGKTALQAASALTAKSLIMAHIHRAELLSVYRHGCDNIIHIYGCGCFFEDDVPGDYADGGANAFSRVITILTHTNEQGNFDIEQISLNRLKDQY